MEKRDTFYVVRRNVDDAYLIIVSGLAAFVSDLHNATPFETMTLATLSAMGLARMSAAEFCVIPMSAAGIKNAGF
jgi:hypothetical protein